MGVSHLQVDPPVHLCFQITAVPADIWLNLMSNPELELPCQAAPKFLSKETKK